ncbi:MAG TPA: hypothetical protein VFX51_04415 [Solirubrobacteraceae bacterium]|nr:hypothetical protein [Solirubrobacteraceae bacterium]
MSIADQAYKVPDDEQSVDTITTTLRDTDDTDTAVRTHERERKNRTGVIQAADQHMGD